MSLPDTGAKDETISVRHAPDRGRWVISVDDAETGFVAHVRAGGRRIFRQTDVRFGGRGPGEHPVSDDVRDPLTPAAPGAGDRQRG